MEGLSDGCELSAAETEGLIEGLVLGRELGCKVGKAESEGFIEGDLLGDALIDGVSEG